MELRSPGLELLRKDQESHLAEYNNALMDKFKFFSKPQKKKIEFNASVLYYQTVIAKFKKRLEERDHEIESCFYMNTYYQEQLKVVQDQCLKLSEEVRGLKELLERTKQEHRDRVVVIKEEFDKEKYQINGVKDRWMAVVGEELKVKDTIQKMLLERERRAMEEIKNLKNIVKIPRAHFKNLENMDYNEIVSQKARIEKSALKLAKKTLNKSRYKTSYLKQSTVSPKNPFNPKNEKSFILPSVKRSRLLDLKRGNYSSKKRVLSHVMSNPDTSNIISTNMSHEEILESSRNRSKHFISPNPRTLMDSIGVNNSRSSLFTNFQ